MSDISQLVKQASLRLSSQPEARLEAEILLAYCLEKPRVFLHTWPDHLITTEQQIEFERLISRRNEGEPIAYILGYQEFWSLTLHVSPATLIPRSETELLVEKALALIAENNNLSILDLGTGSGAIALAIATERPTCKVTATDYSTAALDIAKSNSEKYHIANVRFIQSNWFSELTGDFFDIIVANPPYIAQNDTHLQQGDLPYEPYSALASQDNGLADIKTIIREARQHLKPDGWLLLEHGYNQAKEVCVLLKKQGFQSIHNESDYSGQPRVTLAHQKNSNDSARP